MKCKESIERDEILFQKKEINGNMKYLIEDETSIYEYDVECLRKKKKSK